MISLDEIVASFADNVACQEVAIRGGDHRRGNRCAKAYLAAFQRLREQGDPGREALCKLFEDSRESVRGMAAAFLLRYRTKEAEAILETLARGKGMAAFGAGEALRRWKDGSWSLDPPEMPV
jgi:hypothetical protein